MTAAPRPAPPSGRRPQRRPSWWRRLLAWLARGAAGADGRPQCPT